MWHLPGGKRTFGPSPLIWFLSSVRVWCVFTLRHVCRVLSSCRGDPGRRDPRSCPWASVAPSWEEARGRPFSSLSPHLVFHLQKSKVLTECCPCLDEVSTPPPHWDRARNLSSAEFPLERGSEGGERPGARGAPSVGGDGARGPSLTPSLDALSTRPSSYSLLRNSATERDGDVPFSRGGGSEVWEDGPGDSQSPPSPTT